MSATNADVRTVIEHAGLLFMQSQSGVSVIHLANFRRDAGVLTLYPKIEWNQQEDVRRKINGVLRAWAMAVPKSWHAPELCTIRYMVREQRVYMTEVQCPERDPTYTISLEDLLPDQ